ncbi:glutathione peroxidase [Rhodococcus sp. LBL1]|nr:glutathione peroxidase [Rhodococcus sp. LBL1]MDH6681934.1 glutathione peroxidase [Rhodococcus sp. LBL2]
MFVGRMAFPTQGARAWDKHESEGLARLVRMTTPLQDITINTLGGVPTSLGEYGGRAVLVVNVASKCGLTPQYTVLEKLASEYAERGLSVIGIPCNQFMGQEPGTPEEIQTFCSTTYGVTFPLMEKIEVNGENRHPLYGELTQAADVDGEAGDIQWNFEKFLIAPDGTVANRFRPRTEPDAPEVITAIEAVLPR